MKNRMSDSITLVGVCVGEGTINTALKVHTSFCGGNIPASHNATSWIRNVFIGEACLVEIRTQEYQQSRSEEESSARWLWVRGQGVK